MKKQKLISILICMSIVVILSIVIPLVYHSESISINTEDAIPFNNNWEYTDSEGTVQKVTLPVNLEIKPNEDLVLKNTFPQNFPQGWTFCFRSSLQSIKLVVDGEIIYQRGQDCSNHFGDCVGSSWNLVRIPNEFQGKDFSLILNSPYKAYSGISNEVFYGSKSAAIFKIISEYRLGFAIAIFILALGIIMLIFSLVMVFKLSDYWNVVFLSLFAISISFWLIGESRMLQFLIGNQFFISNISYFALLIIPITFIYYISSACDFHQKNLLNKIAIVCYCNFILCNTLHFLNIFNFYQTMFISHIIILFCCGYFFLILFREYKKYKNKNAMHILLSFAVLAIFVIAELLNFYLTHSTYISKYLRSGILLYIFISVILSFTRIKSISQINQERHYFKKLAYIDYLTSGKNRTAFCRDAELLDLNGKDEIYVVQFDLNGLKEVNDNYGHIAGDKVIINAYYCIKSEFGQIGTCYRIGGDEFTCIIKNVSEEQIEKAVVKLQEKIVECCVNQPHSFSIAVGFAKYDKNNDLNFEATCFRADQLMYENKNLYKDNNII